ncbi:MULTISPECIES: hydrogenase nickel incorporation protein HypB [unclassified Oceanispirochaeta]|uniref:hydrogenase nickel incorporation protein HypB n=1 Tax=unclassified Oceanispirochaeta TaxID=2635722 RepID=UPI000E09C318|nr:MULTISPECIES: hydrogenase nickel incorporation protein HypB [unclassified Oceanispirochaeta]MBF9016026.1 hydrogenase nickel incorporation protein HypB [Oceanispirochaeta sp. M2]NPD72489.1 hydrogenase nickel incorporation protein HypB [Oceanispirochaeta sp. M1]RDG31948.1 hydrogenase accessory protein HypB [Oceanispirochaeta sp. M1]
MDKFKVLEIKKSVYESNDKEAERLRAELKEKGVFLLNLMSSPGSGKTTTVLRTIEALRNEMSIGVMEADLDSSVDADTVSETGTRVIQLHSGGMCHLDALMTRQGIEGLGTDGLDFAILENIGNLICTAEYDTGASKNAMILSVPEGHDKPLKYPIMFSMVDVLLVNKIDAMDFFNFDMNALTEYVTRLNKNIRIIPISAKTGEGVDEWTDWLRTEVKAWKLN